MLRDEYDTHPLLTVRLAIGRLYAREISEVMAAYGLTRMEVDVILFLYHHPRYDTAADLVAHRSMTKSHVSAAVDHLTQLGLLTQRRDENNRRRVHLALSNAAMAVARFGEEAQKRFVARLTDGLTDEDKGELKRLLTRVVENAGQAVKDGDEEA